MDEPVAKGRFKFTLASKSVGLGGPKFCRPATTHDKRGRISHMLKASMSTTQDQGEAHDQKKKILLNIVLA